MLISEDLSLKIGSQEIIVELDHNMWSYGMANS